MSNNIQQPLRKLASLINHLPQSYVGDLPTRTLITEPLPQGQRVPNKSRFARHSDDTAFKGKGSDTFSSGRSGKTVSILSLLIIVSAIPITMFLINNQTKYIGHAAGSTVTFTPTILPYSNPDIGNPWRSQYLWGGGGWTTANDEQLIPQPWPVVDSYHRYSWASLESTEG